MRFYLLTPFVEIAVGITHAFEPAPQLFEGLCLKSHDFEVHASDAAQQIFTFALRLGDIKATMVFASPFEI
jgi:hypothetical protein